MPKAVHDFVDNLLTKKDFYPGRKDRKSLAWVIAYKQLNRKASAVFKLLKCAEELDRNEFYSDADYLIKNAQSYMNEAGEPIMDAADWRREQEADMEPDYDPDRYLDYRDDEEEEPDVEYEAPEHIFKILQQNGLDQGEHHFKPGWAWYWEPVDGAIVFRDASLANKAAEILKNAGVDEESTFYISGGIMGTVRMFFENLNPVGSGGGDNTDTEREDFGWAGDERLMGE